VKWFYLIVAACLFPAMARAQVFVNQAALVQLAGFAVPAPSARPLAPNPVVRHVAHRVGRKVAPQEAVAMVQPKLPAPGKPVAPLPVVAKPVIPPPHLAPAIGPPPPPRPLVIGFAAGSAGLPASAAAGLKPFCAAHGKTIVIDAYAPGDPSDPSAAMRLSMSRAFALRDALAACGVPGASIIPRADGATGPNVQSARLFISGATP